MKNKISEVIILGKKLSIKYGIDNEYVNKQTYSDASGEYRVHDIITWAKKHAKLTKFNVDDLAELAFASSSEESGSDVPGSPDFIERSMKSDLSYPIVVIRYSDGDFIADGNHRLWKARELNHKTIKGYLMSDKDLKNIHNK